MSAPRCPAPPSPTVATGSQTMTDRLAIGRGVCNKRGAAIVTISEVIMGNIALTDAIRLPRRASGG